MTAVLATALGTNALADAGLEWRRGNTPEETDAQSQSVPHHDEAVQFAAHNPFRRPQARTRVANGSAKFRSIMVQRDNRPAVRSSQLPSRDDNLFDESPRSSLDELPEVDTFGLPDEEGSLLDEPDFQETSEPDFRAPDRVPPTYRAPVEDSRTMVEPYDEDSYSEELYGESFDEAANLEDERRKTQELCSQELTDLKASRLNQLSLSIAVEGDEGEDYPFECSIEDGTQFAGRCWTETIYMWKASALCHKPLYFENEQLERYGHSWGPCLQPIMSGAHFFGTLPVLPYCMGVDPPLECQYALGYYRPGNCAPYMINPVPLSWRAGLIEAGAVVGAAAAIP